MLILDQLGHRYAIRPSQLLRPRSSPATDEEDATEQVLVDLNLDIGIYMTAMDEDGRRRLELQLRQKHGF